MLFRDDDDKVAHKPGPRLSLKSYIDVIFLPILLFVCIASSLTLQIKPFFGKNFCVSA